MSATSAILEGRARRLGDMLVVTVTADSFVNKGPGPARFFLDRLRCEMIAALFLCVAYVAVNKQPLRRDPRSRQFGPRFT